MGYERHIVARAGVDLFVKHRNLATAGLALGLAWVAARPAEACTTVALGPADHTVVAKSYDWDVDEGLVLLNPRGLEKQAFLLDRASKPARWTARYSSLTFNQYGRELPNGGINEAGLVVEVMWLRGSRYPARGLRPAVTELQWIQMQLDLHSTVEQMIARRDRVRVSKAYGEVHYMACDASGACATFEHLDGQLVVTRGPDLPVRTLTNHPYSQARRFSSRHQGFGGPAPAPAGTGSLARFVRASTLAQRAGDSSFARAFQILDAVRIPGRTQWQIVYDLTAREVRFRTALAPKTKRVRLDDLAAGCADGARALTIHHPTGGDVASSFEPYRTELADALLSASLRPLRRHLPRGAPEALARYPESLVCRPAAGDP